jgi:hypothetical protein
MHRQTGSLLADRRETPRSGARLNAYLITQAGHQLRGIATSLSRTGAFIETKAPNDWLAGETARLVFTLAEGNVIRLAGYPVLIVREVPGGIGVAYWRSMRSARFGRGF